MTPRQPRVVALRKRCTKCGVEKATSIGFTASPRYVDGYMSWCRRCTAEQAEARRVRYPDLSNSIRQRYGTRLRERVLAHLGGKCVCCGFADSRALQIDHVQNDGHSDPYRLKRRRTALLQAVLRDTSGRYQLLCANCNAIKAHEHLQELRAARKAGVA